MKKFSLPLCLMIVSLIFTPFTYAWIWKKGENPRLEVRCECNFENNQNTCRCGDGGTAPLTGDPYAKDVPSGNWVYFQIVCANGQLNNAPDDYHFRADIASDTDPCPKHYPSHWVCQHRKGNYPGIACYSDYQYAMWEGFPVDMLNNMHISAVICRK
jgi:hypothetical protein